MASEKYLWMPFLVLTSNKACNIILKYGKLEMYAKPRRSVFALKYKEKCK